MPDESVKKTIIVALGVCLVCSILVSSAAVSLKPIQDENKRLDRITNILMASDLLRDDTDIQAVYNERIQPVMIDLNTGDNIHGERFNEMLNIENFDIKTMSDSEEYGRAIPPDKDIARINRMPKQMVIYLVRDNDVIEKVVLPIYGKGLWSTMYGFIVLDKDLTTVQGITFYEHAETPGLGGEIDSPLWKSFWKGKKVFDTEGNLRIKVIKGVVDVLRPEAIYQIDGITGATLTARGVDNEVRFWLGSEGYGPFLKRLKEDLHG